jgi:DNA-binding protein YbaB
MSTGFDMSKFLEQAKNMQTEMEKMQGRLSKTRITKESGGGEIKVISEATYFIIDILFSPEALSGIIKAALKFIVDEEYRINDILLNKEHLNKLLTSESVTKETRIHIHSLITALNLCVEEIGKISRKMIAELAAGIPTEIAETETE